MNKSKKQTGLILIAAAVILVVYLVALFAGASSFWPHGASFWISFSLMMLGVVTAGFALSRFSTKDAVVIDWFFGFPAIRHSIIFLIVEFVLSTLFIVLDCCAVDVPWAIALITQLIVYAIYVVLIVSCLFTRNAVNAIESKVNAKTTALNLLYVDAEMLVSLCATEETKKQFAELAESIRYSDPMSNDLLVPLEGQIQACITDAKLQLTDGDEEGALANCKRAKLLLQERNMKCKVLQN